LNKLPLGQLKKRLVDLHAQIARKIDMKHRRRVTRALEICLLTGTPVSKQPQDWSAAETAATTTHGALIYRNRDELYARINQRVAMMFKRRVMHGVVAAAVFGGRTSISATASKMIGLREIHQHL